MHTKKILKIGIVPCPILGKNKGLSLAKKFLKDFLSKKLFVNRGDPKQFCVFSQNIENRLGHATINYFLSGKHVGYVISTIGIQSIKN